MCVHGSVCVYIGMNKLYSSPSHNTDKRILSPASVLCVCAALCCFL